MLTFLFGSDKITAQCNKQRAFYRSQLVKGKKKQQNGQALSPMTPKLPNTNPNSVSLNTNSFQFPLKLQVPAVPFPLLSV